MQVPGPGWCVTWYPAMPSTTSPAKPEPTHVEVQELDVLGRCASLWAQVGVDLSDQRGVLKRGHAAVCSSSGGVAESIVVCSSTRDKQHASRASRRCSCRGLCGADCRPCRNRHHAKSPSSSLQQLLLGCFGCSLSRAAADCKGPTNTACWHASRPQTIQAEAPGMPDLGQGRGHAFVSAVALADCLWLQQQSEGPEGHGRCAGCSGS